MNKDKEKKKKNSSPIIIILIFIILIFFVFYIPEIYVKYNKEITDFLSKYNLEVLTSTDESTTNEKEIEPVSEFLTLNSNNKITFNELELSNVVLLEDKLQVTIKSNDIKYLDRLNYYLEFYNENNTFLGRRTIKGELVDGIKILELDVKSLNLKQNDKLVISHITIDSISNYDLQNSNILTCNNAENSYNYEFIENKLYKVTFKYEKTYNNNEKFNSDLIYYQDLLNSYKEYNGVNSNISNENSTIIFIASWDYSNIAKYEESIFENKYIFQKETNPGIIKFTLEAEGFECQ